MGRPSDYTAEIATEICDRLSGGESLRAICADERMPHERTVRRWATDDVEGFSPHYARAREGQADHYADEIISIADEAEDAQLGRLRVDARKWVASKLAPKRYGETSTANLNLSGGVTVVMQSLDDRI